MLIQPSPAPAPRSLIIPKYLQVAPCPAPPQKQTVRLHQTLGSSPSLHVKTGGSDKDIDWAREQPGITSHAGACGAGNKLAGNQWGLGQERICDPERLSRAQKPYICQHIQKRQGWKKLGSSQPPQVQLRLRPPAGTCHWPGKNNSFPKKQKPCHCEEQQETNLHPKAKCLTNLKPETFLKCT